jgi:hypothetical protein
MNDLKPVFQYKPVKTEKLKGGKIVPGEFDGAFRSKVAPNTPGAKHHTGENAAGKKWDFWAVDVYGISGVLRWIDCRDGEFGTTIELFLETEKSLRQISIPFGVDNLHDVMNALCGLKKEVHAAMLNVGYWVRVKKDKNGVVKLGDDNNPIWKKSIQFRDASPEFSFDEWKSFAVENGLEWSSKKVIGGTEWDFQAELKYWIGRLVKLQRFLLTTEKVLPFCWNSMTAAASDGTALTLTEGEISTLKAIYEGVKPLYKFPYGRSEATADDFESGNFQAASAAGGNGDSGFPDVDLGSGNAHEVGVPADAPGSMPDEWSDLPF